MCGRFFIDNDTARKLEKTIRMANGTSHIADYIGDIHPTEAATAISFQQRCLLCRNHYASS